MDGLTPKLGDDSHVYVEGSFNNPSQGYSRRSLSCGNSATGSARRSTRSFPQDDLQLETLVFLIRRLLDGSESKTPFVDIIRPACLKGARSKEKTRAATIARTLKRTEGATRQKAFSMGLSLDTRA